jgi:hypothetical protein
MSRFAYYRFLANNIVATEVMQQKDETLRLTEEGFDLKGIHCDSRILKLLLEQFIEILEVRSKYEKNIHMIIKQSSSETDSADEGIQYNSIGAGVYI